MQHSLPPLFLERLKQITGSQPIYDSVTQSFAQNPLPAFRLHQKDSNRSEILKMLDSSGFEIEPVAWNPEGFRLLNKDIRALQSSQPFQNNEIYIQGLSSMLAPLVLNPLPGEKVLDLCAAPGSKAGQIARALKGQGELTANEKIRSRFFKLKANLDALGYANIRLSQKPGELFGKICPRQFDRVLLDSPCSSEGRFHFSRPESWKFWSPRKIKDMVHKQHALFRAAFDALKPGGRMVYATCTYAPEENEGVLAWALKRLKGQMEILDFELPISNWVPGIQKWEEKTFPAEVARAKRILPDGKMTAFFIALVRRV